MKPFLIRLCCTALCWLLATGTFALAQETPQRTDMPNRMGIHTWFIIGVVGAFLAWCISYAIQLQKEALERQQGRGALQKEKDRLLDKIADLEARKEAGQITEQRYKHELREARFHLARVLERINQTEAALKSEKKSS
jgi:hypothetical protein